VFFETARIITRSTRLKSYVGSWIDRPASPDLSNPKKPTFGLLRRTHKPLQCGPGKQISVRTGQIFITNHPDKIDYPAGYQILSVIAGLEPGQCSGHHTHPGVESAYILEGQVVVKIDGKPDLPLEAGQALQFGSGEVHTVCNVGKGHFKALAHYIVEQGKPVATPAP